MDRTAKQASVDIETLGTETDAVVVQVGIAKFSLNEGVIDTVRLNIDPRQQPHRSITADTVMWWLKQSERARAALEFPSPISPTPAICTIEDFLRDCDYVWARGPQFDLSIINSLAAECGRKNLIAWWKWRDERPLRDFLRLANRVPARSQNEVEHDALGDALYQAKVIVNALRLAANVKDEVTS